MLGKIFVIATALYLPVGAGLVIAQGNSPGEPIKPAQGTPGSGDAPNPSETKKVIPEKQDDGTPRRIPLSDDLSEKLKGSDGVIRPQEDIDPEMRKAPSPQQDPAARVLPLPRSPDGTPATPK